MESEDHLKSNMSIKGAYFIFRTHADNHNHEYSHVDRETWQKHEKSYSKDNLLSTFLLTIQ